MAEKKPFAWDSEVLVKTLEVSAYEKREIRICTLKEKEYVSFTTVKKIKEEWKPTGGYTLPKALWSEVSDAIDDFNMADAFGTSDAKKALRAVKNPSEGKYITEKKATRKSTKK